MDGVGVSLVRGGLHSGPQESAERGGVERGRARPSLYGVLAGWQGHRQGPGTVNFSIQALFADGEIGRHWTTWGEVGRGGTRRGEVWWGGPLETPGLR